MQNYTNTYDEKIMKFDVTEGYEAFMKLFDEDEIAEMHSWLEDECDWLFDDANNEQELKEGVVFAYVKEWLVQNVRNMTYNGTEQLFNIIYKM